MAQGSFARPDAKARLGVTPFDVIVIGANLVGGGIALDASARGLRTALLEPADFGAGDCSGGSDLWPLLQAPVNALSPRHLLDVVEAATERQYLRQIAPHLVSELPIVVPALEERAAGGNGTSEGGGGGPVAARPSPRGWWPWARRRARRLGLTSPADLAELVPLLRPAGLAGAWVSTRVEVDEAVLSLALARTAALDGAAVVLNRVGLSIRPDPASGRARVRVEVDGDVAEITARVVVEARAARSATPTTGPRARFLRVAVRRDALALEAALVVPGDEGTRPICCVPGEAHTRLGMVVDGPGGRMPQVEAMLAAVRQRLACHLGAADVTATWEEACPATDAEPGEGEGEDAAGPTRRHPLHQVAPGWVSVLGGTVTTYRELARQTVDAAVEGLDERTRLRLHRRSLTHRLQLRGATSWSDVRDGRDLGRGPSLVDDHARRRLARRYGGEARVVLAMVGQRPQLRRPLVEGLPYLAAEAVYAVRYEMAGGLLDVLARRTPALREDAEATAAAAGRVAELLAPECGWDARRRAAEVGAVRAEAAGRAQVATPAPGY
ncbi:MAG: hypothetical protein GEV08_08645 [Acidimicrobiia bacterium]|nr:hypothetical protein [Acidimicrobiia bacterium]